MPTPCSPVRDPPASRHASRIASASSRAASVSPASASERAETCEGKSEGDALELLEVFHKLLAAETPVSQELGKLVVSKVQNLDGITRTLTCPVVHI